ncbi:MAG TPA: alpha-L-rhamnosidase [Pseudacidobacterium sp.]|nr:alpha-L-rhamnosidase [Pseudacidobacterium sp.]
MFSALGIAAAKSGAVTVDHDIDSPPFFHTSNQRWQAAYDKALDILRNNVQILPKFEKPVLIEGSSYAGIWQECGPHESIVYRKFRPDVARNSHMVFFHLQRPDGQLPANNKRTETGFGQIQMVVPIAATAWELAQATGDHELLKTAYDACSRWDAWLARYRNTRGTGLIEGFCTYDTGMDNSPRWAGIPPQCPDKDAKKCSPLPTLPRLCPDISATIYGARTALAGMAKALGKSSDADRWTEKAEQLRNLILAKLYVPDEAAFYDLDAQNHFVKVRTSVLTRMCGEHIVDQKLFNELWEQQIHNTRAFWAPFPFPSVALDDSAFVRPVPRNSWGGASQALTALRAGRWLDYYGHPAEFSTLMQQWCEAIQRDMTFRQQIDPLSGAFTQGDLPDYSPAALAMMDFTWRLAGIHEELHELHWNARPGHAASDRALFRMHTDDGHEAEIRYEANGATLFFKGTQIARIDGGAARLVTDKEGKVNGLTSISETTRHVTFKVPKGTSRSLTLRANQRLLL